MTVRAVLRRTVGAQWPILAGVNFWRRGALLIGIGVGVAAVLRLVLSENGPACWWCAARGSIS